MSNPEAILLDISDEGRKTMLAVLAARVPERDVWVFGSRARGKAKPYSDLDLAIGGDQPLTLGRLAELVEDFSTSDLPFRVDVVDLASVSAAFRRIIEAGHVLLQKGSDAAEPME